MPSGDVALAYCESEADGEVGGREPPVARAGEDAASRPSSASPSEAVDAPASAAPPSSHAPAAPAPEDPPGYIDRVIRHPPGLNNLPSVPLRPTFAPPLSLSTCSDGWRTPPPPSPRRSNEGTGPGDKRTVSPPPLVPPGSRPPLALVFVTGPPAESSSARWESKSSGPLTAGVYVCMYVCMCVCV